MNTEIYNKIKLLAEKYSKQYVKKVSERIAEMQNDDRSYYLIYQVLGISVEEGNLIDEYQNKGRFLYKYAGAFLEEAAILCFKYKFPDSKKVKIDNTLGKKPKTFEIDLLHDLDAHEIKWRDATTDGDHITKEYTRLQVIKDKGYTPIRIMFYYPQRERAQNIQKTLETLYKGIGGKYFYGNAAWNYIKDYTGIDLLEILQRIADDRRE